MNERMEQEMIRTIQRLRASMPERKNQQASINTLLRLAREEMNGQIGRASCRERVS